LQNLPTGFQAVINADGTQGIGVVVNGQTEVIPGVIADATGLHLLLPDGTRAEFTTSKIISGQYSPFQIYNENGTAIDYAWDAESNVWVKATDVMSSPDAATNEQLIAVNTWADVDKMASKVELFLMPFPADVYFPDKPFNNYDDLTYLNQDSNATANYSDPLGLRNVDSSKWPVRFVEEILLKKGEGRTADTVFIFEQVYNPADKSYSLMKYGNAGWIIKNKIKDEISGYYSLPYWGNKQFWDKTAMRWQADGLLSCSDGCKTSLLN